jgi:hypothetical protein
MIAALYVQTNGVYYGLDGVDPWDETRDARKYDGPWAVIAHPPCARWGRYWSGGPNARIRRKLGDDDGCFAAAFASVRKWGGVLEHPEGSHAWKAFGIPRPPRSGGWVACLDGGWTCCVEQGHYGHRARKATWLYAFGMTPPPLKWGAAEAVIRLDEGFHSAEERRRATRTGACQRMSQRERARTPEPFRDLLISLAKQAIRANEYNLSKA